MHTSAGDLAALLDADLCYSGFNGSVEPFPGMSVRQFAMLALRKSLLKKFHNKEVSPVRNERALAKFLMVNEQCLRYDPDKPVSELEAIALGEARDFIQRFSYYDSGERQDEHILSVSKIDAKCGFGRGANIGARSGDPYGKLAISRLSYTDPALLMLFQHTISSRKTWVEQEQFRSQFYPSVMVQGSKLSFVPKTSDITRTICTEPILNMFFQKGIAACLERRLNEVVGIDLSLQPDKNRELARRGSITGEFGTIDLSNASDSMSMSLVRRWFDPIFVYWLNLTRSDKTILPNGEIIDLHMVSSMGNAYTFPLQTLFFTSLVYGAYRALDIPIERPFRHSVGNFAVFGDDIIVHSKAYGLVVKMLNHCGFTVNVDKSFNSGTFRESCGSDWFSGHNVRGVYLQKLLDDQDCYSAYNRLAVWAARWGVPLSLSLDYLRKAVEKPLFVPLHEAEDSGFRAPLHFCKPTYAKYVRGKPGIYRYRYATRRRKFVKLPYDVSELKPTTIRKLQRAIPGWRYNPAGLALLSVHGNIRDGRILLRDDGGSAEYRKAYSLYWDYTPLAGSERAGFEHNYHFVLSQSWYDC